MTRVSLFHRLGLLALLALWAAGCRPRQATVEVSVFFTRSEGNTITLAEVRRTVPRGDIGASVSRRIIAALIPLLEGPTAEERAAGLVTSIPKGTHLRSVSVQDGVASVDLSHDIEAGGGSASMLGRFWQIVYTATQFPEAPRVQILIDGQERQAMGGEGVIIEQPIGRPPTPPRF